MADLDDWLAVIIAVQGVTADQMGDYISALTADGPLVPVKRGRLRLSVVSSEQ